MLPPGKERRKKGCFDVRAQERRINAKGERTKLEAKLMTKEIGEI
jgi:hypothetical protein